MGPPCGCDGGGKSSAADDVDGGWPAVPLAENHVGVFSSTVRFPSMIPTPTFHGPRLSNKFTRVSDAWGPDTGRTSWSCGVAVREESLAQHAISHTPLSPSNPHRHCRRLSHPNPPPPPPYLKAPPTLTDATPPRAVTSSSLGSLVFCSDRLHHWI